ncbi:hypothetical protein FQA39_LY07130 [Lamprigera yunnana]|nr:hypothetical protein FQA39_LY07130 [Lamprigera yunnana]
MALVQCANKMRAVAQTTCKNLYPNTAKSSTIKKTVFISQSTDIYTNLALEEWLYRNWDFNNNHILMLWQNDPCVLLGKHQNPWLETNPLHLTDLGVDLARRCSGGNTFYQDLGNLNATFFSPKNYYNHKCNMELIVRAVFRKYSIKLHVSSNEDLLLRNSKIGIRSKVSRSTKCKISNLCEENPKIEVKGLLTAIGWEYLRTPINSLKDGGKNLANKQNGFQLVNPTEQWFPGLNQIRETLQNWEWCYGETPQFTVTKSFQVPGEFTNSYDAISDYLNITMVVERGRIKSVSLYVPRGFLTTDFFGEATIILPQENIKFTQDSINSFEWSLYGNYSSLNGNKSEKQITAWYNI